MITHISLLSWYCPIKVCKPLFFLFLYFENYKKEESMELTHSQISEILSNYTSSSEGFVTLQSLIMNSLMFHERELFVSENAHEQCNGFRPRRWYSHGFEFSLRIPRSRSGNFYLVLLGLIRNEGEERARLFYLPYTKGLTTEQIGEISDCVYGRAYSKQQVSHLAGSCRDDVERWLGRSLSSHYLAVYIDATFISTRRDRQVSKEAYYNSGGIGGRQQGGAHRCQSPHRGCPVLERRA